MIINRNDVNTKHVKFISYNGIYPHLCMGMLTLEIDGETITFGNDKSAMYPKFWESGGDAYFINDYTQSFVNTGEWVIDYEDLPEKYAKYADEIDEVFNNNVTFGCCGGCA